MTRTHRAGWIFAALSLGALPTSVLAQATVGTPTVSGTGCADAGSFKVTQTQDPGTGKVVVSIDFFSASAYSALAKRPETPLDTQSCNLAVPVTVPPNTTLSIASFDA